MTAATTFRSAKLDRRTLAPAADWLAVAVAVSLPWSTTATGALVVLWLLALLPTLDAGAVKRELLTAPGGLPVLLCALAGLGLLWADVSWSERLGGFSPFTRFLIIPLLLAQFRRSEHGMRVLCGFLLSVLAVLFCSWALVLFPHIPWRASAAGVPVKDYILQSEEFLICGFVLFAAAFDQGRRRRWRVVLGLALLVVALFANIAFVATGRTTLLVASVLAILLGWRQYRWGGLLGAIVLVAVVGGAAAFESPYLRERLDRSVTELRAHESRDAVNSTSLHVDFLKESLSSVERAPFIGHGTGSIPEQFREMAAGRTGASGIGSVNPHNQILAVAIQLGLVGTVALLAMWIAHLLLFRGPEMLSWIGVVIVTDNIASSLVNTHLFDFTQAWLYVFGVGAAGGAALRRGNAAPFFADRRDGVEPSGTGTT